MQGEKLHKVLEQQQDLISKHGVADLSFRELAMQVTFPPCTPACRWPFCCVLSVHAAVELCLETSAGNNSPSLPRQGTAAATNAACRG